jgi:hypothetical protein
MSTHQVEAVLSQDGTLVLNDLPFHAGEAVEVIIVSHNVKTGSSNPYPLHKTPLIYDDPAEPVAVDDWEAVK